MCGEKPDILPLSAWTRGSPPRMRGKVQLQPGQPAALGITPAYAGKSKNLPALVCGNGDHPRVCGEKRPALYWWGRCRGSPPRMRGKVTACFLPQTFPGITPAYAGKRNATKYLDRCVWDHPRVCGEKSLTAVSASASHGSPPRMRGKVGEGCVLLIELGITPAYAGKRLLRLCRCSSGSGSPPRMRGKD